jgi:hypothetical protein
MVHKAQWKKNDWEYSSSVEHENLNFNPNTFKTKQKSNRQIKNTCVAEFLGFM